MIASISQTRRLICCCLFTKMENNNNVIWPTFHIVFGESYNQQKTWHHVDWVVHLQVMRHLRSTITLTHFCYQKDETKNHKTTQVNFNTWSLFGTEKKHHLLLKQMQLQKVMNWINCYPKLRMQLLRFCFRVESFVERNYREVVYSHLVKWWTRSLRTKQRLKDHPKIRLERLMKLYTCSNGYSQNNALLKDVLWASLSIQT